MTLEIFSEVYNCYYSVVDAILKKSPLSKQQIDDIIRCNAFSESVLFLMPKLCNDNRWNLLECNQEDLYASTLKNKPFMPLTTLEKSWIKSLLLDDKFKLFITDELFKSMEAQLQDVQPLFNVNNFFYFDKFSNGDDYSNISYKSNFLYVLKAIQNKKVLLIDYTTSKNKRVIGYFQPLRLEYSLKNDKFRLFTAKLHNNNEFKYYILNISGINNVSVSNKSWVDSVSISGFFKFRKSLEPITVKVINERNGINRFMMEFACYEKYTEYDNQNDTITSQIWYDTQTETELLIRLLSFGPVLEIVSPKKVREQAKQRIKKQFELFFNNI